MNYGADNLQPESKAGAKMGDKLEKLMRHNEADSMIG